MYFGWFTDCFYKACSSITNYHFSFCLERQWTETDILDRCITTVTVNTMSPALPEKRISDYFSWVFITVPQSKGLEISAAL